MKKKKLDFYLGLEGTGCCAFTQLRAGGNWKEEDLDELLFHHEIMVSKEWDPRRLGGAPTIFCMAVIPGEERLVEALRARKFIFQQNLPRRRGYPEGHIAMFVRTFPTGRDPLQWSPYALPYFPTQPSRIA